MASDVCGVQAQVLSGAALSLWARVDNITIQDVEDALWKQRTLVKTWAMRGTLHLLSSNSLSTYAAALKTRQDHNSEMIKKRAGIEITIRPFKTPSSAQKLASGQEAGLLREFFGTSIKVYFDA